MLPLDAGNHIDDVLTTLTGRRVDDVWAVHEIGGNHAPGHAGAAGPVAAPIVFLAMEPPGP
ncbi:MAG: hypothetical protein R2851_16695 [Caldilineaceae bacterium]